MLKSRKNIAVVMAQPESAYQTELMRGINEEAFRLGFNTLLIATQIKEYSGDAYSLGETQIYKLLNSPIIDGIIVVPDLLQLKDSKQIVNNILSKFSGPVVLINEHSDVHKCVFENSDDDFEMLTEHLYTVHGCRNFACMLGPKEHEHSKTRRKSIEKAFEKRNIKLDESSIYYGDFWYNEGENVANSLLKKSRLPDAVMCISDAMAVSLRDAFIKLGVRVPEDIIITGYDANNSGSTDLYSITSIAENSVALGRNAVKILASQLCDSNEYIPDKGRGKIILSPSCGCATNIIKKLVPVHEITQSVYDDASPFYSGYNFMNEEMVDTSDLKLLMWKIQYYHKFLSGSSNIVFCLCKFLIDLSKGIDVSDHPATYSEDIYSCLDNSETKIVDIDRKFPLSELYPKISKPSASPTEFIFSPLHFNNTNFGYVIIECDKPQQPVAKYMSQWIRNCAIALESLRRQMELKIMYRKFEESTVKDLPTGLYSRNGFNLFSADMLKKAVVSKYNFAFILADLNCLKHINDVYGHGEGDRAIKTASELFSAKVSGNEIFEQKNFRIGGDEFVKILLGRVTDKEINSFIESVNVKLNDFNKHSDLPYSIYISIGYYNKIPDQLETIDNILKIADERMFENKKLIKEKTGYDFKRL